jgi:hypothetical protein
MRPPPGLSLSSSQAPKPWEPRRVQGRGNSRENGTIITANSSSSSSPSRTPLGIRRFVAVCFVFSTGPAPRPNRRRVVPAGPHRRKHDQTQRRLRAKGASFPSPRGSRPARSLAYQCGGRIYLAVIGHQRRRWDGARGAAAATAAFARAGPGSGNTVISIVATKAAIEIWSREPTLGWPNPSLVPHDAVLSIEYLDKPDTVASLWRPRTAC